MKFRAYTPTPTPPPPPAETFFKLVPGICEGVKVIAVNADGSRVPKGNILLISDEGVLERMSDINDTLGLDLDEYGRIKLKP